MLTFSYKKQHDRGILKTATRLSTPPLVWAALVCLLVAGVPVAAATVADIKTLLRRGKDREAYDAGRAAPDALGTPMFDFYFGIAALNAGAPG